MAPSRRAPRSPLLTLALLLSLFARSTATYADSYNLELTRQTVNQTGTPASRLTINGSIPGPTLHWREGEDVTVTVANKLDENSSIHWHGLLVPGDMDGVPGLNGFHGIHAGSSYTYHFPVRQAGTYWYHAHSNGQEADGLYGALVIAPKNEAIKADQDYVVLLSEASPELSSTILGNLKMKSSYYNYGQRTLADFIASVRNTGFKNTFDDLLSWGQMRMAPTDLADVSGFTFLVNGKGPTQNETFLFTPGQRVRLRVINASSMSFFDLRIPGLALTVVQADGQAVEPVSVDELRIGVAETYDLIVEPKEDLAYTFVAEPIDRTGFALATLATKEGMRGEIPPHRPRTLLTMADMGMSMHMDMSMHGAHHHHMPRATSDSTAGWAATGGPDTNRVLRYADLRSLGTQPDTREPTRDITMELGGNMERYVWTLSGEKFGASGPVRLKFGERVRIKFVNTTMMAHPMHLHGMFVQLENGASPEKLPNKHTIIIPPGQTVSVLLSVTEEGEWAFHCHLLYHMLSGMMTSAVVSRTDGSTALQGASHVH